MGRSVSYPPHTAAVTFGTFEGEDRFDWEEFAGDFQFQVRRLFPSTYEVDIWLGREDHVYMANDHAYFGLSEYGGLVAYWMVPRDDGERPWLAEAWCRRVADKFADAFGTLRKVGTFSNGGGVYARKDGAPAGPDQFETSPYTISGLVTDG